MKIFGYGTFITSGIYQNFQHVRAAFLPGYVRILRPVDPFPYIIRAETKNQSSGFWGLVFEVDVEGLKRLDFYEGGLYKRIHVDILYSDGASESVMVYYPTQRVISQYHRLDYITDEDPWRTQLLDHPDIIAEFPELGWKHPPKID